MLIGQANCSYKGSCKVVSLAKLNPFSSSTDYISIHVFDSTLEMNELILAYSIRFSGEWFNLY